MLISLFDRIFRSSEKKIASVQLEKKFKLEKANQLRIVGNVHEAIEAYKDYLKDDPQDVEAINNLGVCLGDVGDNVAAGAAFELAYSLDDAYIPGVINHAKHLFDLRRSDDALPFLLQAWSCDPTSPGIYLIYSSILFRMGEVARARKLQLYAWLANFESMRYANNYLFLSSYDDIDEEEVATEHRFWAETVRPLDLKSKDSDSKNPPLAPTSKIRIGYWSPDFRNHSVRYFFRALLENHDRSKFEIFLYHDIHTMDAQSELIKNSCDQFHDVYKLTDSELYDLVQSHQLDIFVEMAGHTSANRIAMLQYRFAKLQISALGYPPTTGLSTIDAKLMDRYLVKPGCERYYAEAPMVLPASFWCFDPLESAPISEVPPVDKNGHVTFACIGNTAKINERILKCWREILKQVPSSRLLIRSINFEDPAAEQATVARLEKAGIDMSRVDLRKPEKDAAFFDSYAEVDLILDTYPFNGGTTSCFAVYMGVPVVSLVGSSVLSRMGLSILANMGFPELAVHTDSEYIEKAIHLARSPAILRDFRENARNRLQDSSLGNGRLFARDFEEACVSLLEQKEKNELVYKTEIPVLPVDELVRRARMVLSRGQPDGAMRILNHCLKHYPHVAQAHMIVADLVAREKRYDEAEEYLSSRLEYFDRDGKIAVFLKMAGWDLQQEKNDDAFLKLEKLERLSPDGVKNVLQLKLYKACEQWAKQGVHLENAHFDDRPRRIDVLIPSDDPSAFESVCQNIRKKCQIPTGWQMFYRRCDENRRVSFYEKLLRDPESDIVLIVQKRVEIHAADFFMKIVDSLAKHDLVGMSGAKRWQRLDWRSDEFHQKSAAYLTTSAGSDRIEVQLYGDTTERCASGMAILDGHLLALNASKVRDISFDEDLVGAGLLVEERWSHLAYQSQLHLAVRRDLGVVINQDFTPDLDLRHRSPGVLKITTEMGFEPFLAQESDNDCTFMSFSEVEDALNVLEMYYKD